MKFLAILVAIAATLVSAATVQASNAPVISQTKTFSNGDVAVFTAVLDSDVGIQAGCGTQGAQGTVRYNNHFGVTLWTYRQYVNWNYCNYKVTKINGIWDEPVDTCCNWGWRGRVALQHTAPGGASIMTYTKGHFASCISYIFGEICSDKYPWIQLRVNGNGLLTGFWWGIDG